MIQRIVKMSFYPHKVQDFLNWFDTHKEKIKSFEGCLHLELWRDTIHPNVFYTYSVWNNEESIEKYRKSDIFNNVWSFTKQLFNDSPLAFSAKIEKIVTDKNPRYENTDFSSSC